MLPVLYHQSRTNKIFSWLVWTEGAEICTEYGPDDGKKQLVRKTVKGKNIGKSNETTPAEQADKEALAMWTHKLERKYSRTKKKAKDVVFLPMLAHDYTKKYMKRGKSLEYPVDVQPKLDGVRCMAYIGPDQTVQLMSRGGKPWFVEHIAEELAPWIPEGYVLDGEFYVHGRSLQNIIHLVKNNEDPDHKLLEFRVFDGFYMDSLEPPWAKRGSDLRDLLYRYGGGNSKIKSVPTKYVESEEELFEMLTAYEGLGYEGIIIRKPEGKYNLGHRSPDLLKLKKFMDDEFEVVGYHHGSGREVNCVVWDCVTKEGIQFGVRPMGTVAEREQMLKDAEQYINKKLTVKFQQFTDDGVPQFPVGVVFREDL